ncbi:peptidoglycan binding protein CsiV [Shewanella sp. H8]|uniref:peptidoglycan binding protein CsiV n=1 Tax=Shewanella sp. H8 TaxID=3342676 RepID=UPI003315451B
MLRKIAMTIAAITALSHSFSAHAESWFEVEVFVFERQQTSVEKWLDATPPKLRKDTVDIITPVISTDITGVAVGLNGCSSTDWASDASNCNDPKVSNITTTYPSQVPFNIAASKPQTAYLGQGPLLLAQSQGKFNDIIRTIQREPYVKSLVHLTWQQNMQSRRRSKPIRIFGGQDFSKSFEYHGLSVKKPTQIDAMPSTDFSALGSFYEAPKITPVWELDGSINIYLSHYLYIENNLVLRKVTQKMVESSPLTFNEYAALEIEGKKQLAPYLESIPLIQNRRVRSGEIHYFDNPQLGIVMQIRKMAQPTNVKPIDLIEPSSSSAQPVPYTG